jgi:nucleotide-binding universal stress UspA family protein
MVPGRSGSDPTVMRELVLLLATDGSPGAAVARSAALDLAGGGGWPLHVVHVWQPPVVFPYLAFLTPPDFPRAYQEQGESILLEERHQVENGGGTVSGTHLVEGRPADTILRVAEEVGNALLVIGSRGLGRLERLALGTVSEEVLHHSHRPVLVTRGGSGAWPPSHVVAGDDGSAIAVGAARLAGALAHVLGVRLVLVQVLPHLSDEMTAGPGMSVDAALAAAGARLGDRGGEIGDATGATVLTRLAFGSAATGILDVCRADGERPLLVCGSRGAGLIQRLRLGSVSRRLLHASHGPILVVPGHPEEG